jgi:Uma2 family endonuclease
MAIPAVNVRRWTRREYERMVEAGYFGPDERLELVDGIIYEMTPQSSPHAVAVRLTRQALAPVFSEGFDILVQMPLALGDDGEPEPDLAVVAGSPRDHLASHPRSALLVVEVADTSLHHDRERKASLYARAGIPDYWILALGGRKQLEVLRDPVDGVYRTRIVLGPKDRVSPLARPDVSIPVSDLFP